MNSAIQRDLFGETVHAFFERMYKKYPEDGLPLSKGVKTAANMMYGVPGTQPLTIIDLVERIRSAPDRELARLVKQSGHYSCGEKTRSAMIAVLKREGLL
jgi:hypothetical protein